MRTALKVDNRVFLVHEIELMEDVAITDANGLPMYTFHDSETGFLIHHDHERGEYIAYFPSMLMVRQPKQISPFGCEQKIGGIYLQPHQFRLVHRSGALISVDDWAQQNARILAAQQN